MRLTGLIDTDKFFQVVDSCKGKVELISGEGDRLNLKSKLNQYVSLVKLSSREMIGKLEVIASDPADMEKIMNFIMNGQ